MEAIYDDHLHVLKACAMLESQPGYRPLVNWLTCQTGESLTTTSWMSFGFLLVFAIFLVRLMPPNLDEKLRGYRLASMAALFAHPLYLFPFFYPSQISTSMTMFWAGLSFWILDLSLPIFIFAPLALGLAAIGNFVRVEAAFFWLLLAGAVYVFRGPARGEWNPLLIFGRAKFAKFAGFFVLALGLGQLFSLPFFRALSGVSVANPATTVVNMLASATEPNYPQNSHWPVQAYAQLLYLKNFLYPFGFSFFGPWNHWWVIYQNQALQVGLCVGVLALIGTLAVWGARAKHNSARRYAAFGLLIFLGTTIASSASRRVDWYFVSREVLGIGLFIPFAAAAIQRITIFRQRRFASLLVTTYLVMSLAGVAFVKYRNLDLFLFDESTKVGETSPYVNYERMRIFEKRGEWERARKSAYQVYTAIPPDSIAFSRAARRFRESSLAKSYELAELLGDHVSARSALKALMKSDSYLSTWVCLKSGDYAPEQCLEGGRHAKFCASREEVKNELELCGPEDLGQLEKYCGKKI